MKRYLITGASRGIGRSIAAKLAAPDCELLLHGRDADALEETAELVRSAGSVVRVLKADLSRTSEVEALIDQVSDKSLDLLVNNAGMAVVEPFEKITLQTWEKTMAVNLTAPFLLINRLTPRMPNGAIIVNILSVAAEAGFAGWSAYCASKFALKGFAAAIRNELSERGIRVVNIYPAATNTDIWNDIPGDWPRDKMMDPADVAEAIYTAVTEPDPDTGDDIRISGSAGNL